jgi:hypothetical protein
MSAGNVSISAVIALGLQVVRRAQLSRRELDTQYMLPESCVAPRMPETRVQAQQGKEEVAKKIPETCVRAGLWLD